ncbi:MAG: caspase family protein [Rhizobiaceae bacterium]|nr:caspase family protein [Rhizobiaceae bacterium]
MKRSFQGFGDDRDFAGAIDDPSDQVDELESEAPATEQTRRALLIGNGKYRNERLRNPVRDVRLVGTALRQLGFAVEVIEDADLATMRSAIGEFALSLEEDGANAVALIYFAGHGLQWQGVNYLVPSNADIPHRRYLPVRALALDDIVGSLSRKRRAADVIIVDACRNNPIPDGELPADDEIGARNFNNGLAALSMTPAGMLVAYSTAAGQVAYDGKKNNSPYALALTTNLPRLLEPGQRIHEIFVETADAVRKETGGRQTPALFLQGGLPPMTLDRRDAMRLRTYDPWRRRRTINVSIIAGAVVFLLLFAVSFAYSWSQTDPEVRQAMLAYVGLAADPAAALSCKGTPGTDTKDQFGLSPKDWCTLQPVDLLSNAEKTQNLKDIVAKGIAAGDAKALFLDAEWMAARNPSLSGGAAEGVTEELQRSGYAGLPVAAYLLDELGVEGFIVRPPPEQIKWAADSGHVMSQAVLLAYDIYSNSDPSADIARLEALEPSDTSGEAAWILGDLYLRGLFEKVAPDASKASHFLVEAALKGSPQAMGFVVNGPNQMPLSSEDLKTILRRDAQRNGPVGRTWIQGLLSTNRPDDRRAAAVALRERVELYPNPADETELALLDIQGFGGDDVDTAAEINAMLDKAAAAGYPQALDMRGEMRMGLYRYGDGTPIAPIDPAGAFSDLQTAAAPPMSNLLAAYHLGFYYLYGIGGAPDPHRAVQWLREASAGDNTAPVQALARPRLNAIDTADNLAKDASSTDVHIGDDTAPLSIIAYFDPACSNCSGSSFDMLNHVKDSYVKHGYAHLTLRPVSLGADTAPLLGAFPCLAPEDRQKLMEQLFSATGLPAPPPECAATDKAGVASANEARKQFVRTLLSANTTEMAPDEILGEPVGQQNSAHNAAAIFVDGWLVSPLTPQALEHTMYLLLSPSRQLDVDKLAKQSCEGGKNPMFGEAVHNGRARYEAFCD